MMVFSHRYVYMHCIIIICIIQCNLHPETSVNLNLIHVFIFEKTKLTQPNDLDDIYKKHQKSFLTNINHPRWSVQDDKNMM